MSSLSNRYQIERKYIKIGKARSGQQIKKVLFLVAHETANPTADADDHFNYFNNSQPSASAHTFIDDTKVLEIVPLWEKAFHVWYDRPLDNQIYGDDANDAAIGVELCRTGDFKKAYDRYVWYFAYLCKHFGLDPKKHIISHKKLDPTRRSDPDSWLNPNGVTFDNFINHVVSYVNQWDAQPKPATVTKAERFPYLGILKEGSKGSNVKLIQSTLGIADDGIFGPKTTATVKAWQAKNKLAADGVIGNKSWAVMFNG